MSHPVDTGQKTEAIVLAELVKRDYRVLVPFGVNHRYDLVIDQGGQFLRVQCKTGRLANGVVTFNASSTQGGNARDGAIRRGYKDEADVFLVYCPGTDKVYWILVEEAGTAPNLRVDPPKNNQTTGIRWARDYELAP